jgi:hypothetical protein
LTINYLTKIDSNSTPAGVAAYFLPNPDFQSGLFTLNPCRGSQADSIRDKVELMPKGEKL